MAVLLAVLFPALACAQSSPGAAPPGHPGTKLNFPSSIAGATLERSYTTPIGRDVEYVYQYTVNKLGISVFLFPGSRYVLPGSENPMVTTQFTSELDAAQRALKRDDFTDFERPAAPSSCTYGSIVFRCIVYSAVAQRDRVFSKLLLTGYNGHFLKIRADWSQGSGQTVGDAEKELRSFIPALLH